MRFTRKKFAALAAGTLTLGLSVGAYAYFTAPGVGSASASVVFFDVCCNVVPVTISPRLVRGLDFSNTPSIRSREGWKENGQSLLGFLDLGSAMRRTRRRLRIYWLIFY